MIFQDLTLGGYVTLGGCAEETPFYGDNLWVFLVLELWLRAHIIDS